MAKIENEIEDNALHRLTFDDFVYALWYDKFLFSI